VPTNTFGVKPLPFDCHSAKVLPFCHNRASSAFTPVAFCPGYARGLAFIGRFAVIGLSKPRDHTFNGLALDDWLAAKSAAPRCGLMVIDLASGAAIEWMRFDHTITELYDVAVLPQSRQAEAVGFVADDIEREVSVDPA
jgi:uncharacterized protein (TIGR03032 family)